MRIVYVITGLVRAGAETQVKDLATTMSARGHNVGVVSLTKPEAYADELNSAGVDVCTLNMTKNGMRLPMLLRARNELRNYIRAKRPDVVHSHMFHANLICRSVTALLPTAPLICTIHNVREGVVWRDWAYRLTNWASVAVTTISNAATESFVDAGVLQARNTLTIYNGINTDIYRCPPVPRDQGGFRWIAIGRLHDQKDYPTLLSALKACPDATLDVVGQGELRPHLERMTEELGIGGRVRFLGLRDDVPELLPQYDAFVLSSAWEGFGIVVVEAMASGLPVVATRSGGPQEIIGEDEQAGFLVTPRSPTELAAAMTKLMLLPAEQRRLMGERGRRRALERFSLEAIASQWEEIYRGAARAQFP